MTAKNGDMVLIHYTGKFDTGEVFDSSKEEAPLNFIVGEGNIIRGFEEAVVGMEKGEKKSISLTPAQAYGEYSKERVLTTELKNFGESFQPEKDMQLALQLENGERVMATVVSFDKENITLDLNHPLAGKNLNFDLELVDIKDPSEMPSCGSGGCSSCKGCG